MSLAWLLTLGLFTFPFFFLLFSVLLAAEEVIADGVAVVMVVVVGGVTGVGGLASLLASGCVAGDIVGEVEGGVGKVPSPIVLVDCWACFARFRADLESLGCVVSVLLLVEKVEEGVGVGVGASALEGALLTAAIPGGGPRIPAPAVCENLIFCGYFRFAVVAAGRG